MSATLACAGDAARPTTLKAAFKDSFHVGFAISAAQFAGDDQAGRDLVLREADTISPENALKWNALQPHPGVFEFTQADRYVAFGVEHGLWTIGHTLVWHEQLPAWVAAPGAATTTLTQEELSRRLREHISTVVGRYRGRIKGWDVVNEVVADGGGYRPSIFYRTLGADFIASAFQWAHEADPAAELYYNDYNLDADDAKRATALELVRSLRARGVPIHGVGLQGHYNLTQPSAANIDETIRLFAQLGVKVLITELDVEVNRVASGVTGAVGARAQDAPAAPLTARELSAQAQRYAELFAVFRKNRAVVTRVTLWGLRDRDSWRRTSHPLLFDDNYASKPAYRAVIEAAAK